MESRKLNCNKRYVSLQTKVLRHENVKNVLNSLRIEYKNYIHSLKKKNGDKLHIIQNSNLKYKVYLDAKIEFYGPGRH